VNDAARPFVEHFDAIYRERMSGLPVVNERLAVDLIGDETWKGHRLGVLLTPWFMNLLLIPGDDAWDEAGQGDRVALDLPSGPIEFLVTHDDELGTYLTAVLFGSVTDFPDLDTARAVAEETLRRVLVPPAEGETPDDGRRRLSRRGLFTRLGSS